LPTPQRWYSLWGYLEFWPLSLDHHAHCRTPGGFVANGQERNCCSFCGVKVAVSRTLDVLCLF
jgi:hypothetical protein